MLRCLQRCFRHVFICRHADADFHLRYDYLLIMPMRRFLRFAALPYLNISYAFVTLV